MNNHHYHNHVVPPAWISLTFSRHFSLSFIASGRSSELHPVLRAIFNKSWRQHPTRHQLYNHPPPITKTIKVRRTRHAGHCWRSRDELINDVLLWTPAYGQAKAGRPARTYTQHMNTFFFYLVKSYVLKTFATFCYNYIQETTLTQPRDASIITHTHTHTRTQTLTISNTNFTQTYKHTKKSQTNLNINIHLTIFFDFFDFSNIFLRCPMIVAIRRHETLGHK